MTFLNSRYLIHGQGLMDVLVDCPFKRTLDNLGTKYGTYEVNKEEDGDIVMNVLSAVTGNRMVSHFKAAISLADSELLVRSGPEM